MNEISVTVTIPHPDNGSVRVITFSVDDYKFVRTSSEDGRETCTFSDVADYRSGLLK